MSDKTNNNNEADIKAQSRTARASARGGFVAEEPAPALKPAAPKKAAEPKAKKVRTGPGCFTRAIGLMGLAFGIFLLVAFLGALKYSVLFLPPEEVSREVVVRIPEGAGAAQIGQVLEEAGVVKSGRAFVWTLRAKSKIQGPVVLKAGEMALDPSLPVWQTIDLIAKGNYKRYPFTVPEGRNIYEIAKMIEEAGLGNGAEFMALCRDKSFINSLGLEGDSLEGYLFPETYSFPKGTPLKTIIKTMTDTFHKVWRKYDDLAGEKGLTRNNVVILASIVEKETGVSRERPVIAGVFFNRLAKGMKLQTDPTVIYGLLPNFDGNITRKDLQTPHPYNTYVIPGLPPGPICNPGEASIAAVVTPSIVPYYYFVSKNDGSGSHDFSETLKEHNRKVDRYIRKKSGRTNRR